MTVLALLGHAWVLYDPSPGEPVISFPLADKVVHVLVFAVPLVLAAWAGLRWRLLLVGLAVHAPLSEAVQARLLEHRSGDPMDVLADLVGVGVAAALVVWRSSRSEPAPARPRGDDAA